MTVDHLTDLQRLLELVKARFPDAILRLDAAEQPDGVSWLDAYHHDYALTVQWSRTNGFGVSRSEEGQYSSRPDEVFHSVEDTFERVKRLILSRGRTRKGPITLAGLRELNQVSQVELAKRLEVNQASISRLERRPDFLLSTLRAVIQALGGELELRVRLPQGTFRLEVEPSEREGAGAA